MRGKPHATRPGAQTIRNIPAYAGKTCITLWRALYGAEHPRVCGENAWPVWCPDWKRGTSPRMRGKQSHTTRVSAPPRNIPAYAGKTIGQLVNDWDTAEHPRVCGENKHQSQMPFFFKGTSPRMRGKQIMIAHIRANLRNIPAYAGKTDACVDHFPV